jgi:hypothetical protein
MSSITGWPAKDSMNAVKGAASQRSQSQSNPKTIIGYNAPSNPFSRPQSQDARGFYTRSMPKFTQAKFGGQPDFSESDQMASDVRRFLTDRSQGSGLESTAEYQQNLGEYQSGLKSYLAGRSLAGGYDPAEARGVQFEMSRDPLAADARIAAQQEQQQAKASLVDFEDQMRSATQELTNAQSDYERFINDYNLTADQFMRYYTDQLGYNEDSARQQAQIDLQRYGLSQELAAKQSNFEAAEQRRRDAAQRFQMGMSIFGSVAGLGGLL